jgi:hypothetical protein
MLKEHGVTGAINVGDDRAHRSGTRFLNVAYPDGRQRAFAGQAVEHMADGLRDRPARRLPGALAALQSDRAAPRLTKHLLLRADDGHDHVEIRIRVTNCGALAHTVAVEAWPESAGVALHPDALTLGLWEHGTVIASLAIPAKAGVGEEREGLIWVRGDRDHVLRWTVRVTAHAGNCCHQVDVADCPDLVHHWYVHFYCERPGSGGSR